MKSRRIEPMRTIATEWSPMLATEPTRRELAARFAASMIYDTKHDPQAVAAAAYRLADEMLRQESPVTPSVVTFSRPKPARRKKGRRG